MKGKMKFMHCLGDWKVYLYSTFDFFFFFLPRITDFLTMCGHSSLLCNDTAVCSLFSLISLFLYIQ